jgi:hypothetical protein
MEMRILGFVMGLIGLFAAHDAGREVLQWVLTGLLMFALVSAQVARQITQRLGPNPEAPAMAGKADLARRWNIAFLLALVLILLLSTYAMFVALFG